MLRLACLLLVSFSFAGLGCGTRVTSACDPPCGAGTACDEALGLCVPDAPGGDMAVSQDGPPPGCSPACAGLTPYCNAAKKCVGCLDDKSCPQGSYCKVAGPDAATCVPGCKDDLRCGGGKCCTMRCVDVGNDANNCGACGNKCSGNHTQAICVAGKCQMGKCDSGWGDCNKDPKDGCETNLHVDANHCTGCGMKCSMPNAVNACADGCYATACKWGFDDCNNDPMDGCETSVLADGLNCGACGKSCAKLPNAAAGCMNGSCVLGMCNAGYTDCDGDPKNGCESFTAADPKNCGGCGKVCPMNLPGCANGQCANIFTFKGISQNLPITSLAGWSECYRDTYANSATNLADIIAKCTGSNLLIACRPVGSMSLTLAAMAPRADVLFNTGDNNNNLHTANGVSFYYSTSYSWGFVPEGEPVSRNSCDTGNTKPELRMCWHTGGGRINSGYRCGGQFLNGSNAWERLVYQSN